MRSLSKEFLENGIHLSCPNNPSGRIRTTIGDEEFEVGSGSFLFIPKNTPHSYENLSDGKSQFMCIIPAVEDRDTELLKD